MYMFCSKCGREIPEGGVCPVCSPAAASAPVAPAAKKKNVGITDSAKKYAALLTAAMVFPATISTAIDLSFHRYDFWFGYVVGALIVAWVCAVLPVLKITPAPVTAVICFTSIMGYTFFIIQKTGHLEWLYQRALPLFILFALFVAADAAAIGSKKVNGLGLASMVSFEIGVYLIAIEAFATKSLENLHWSPIFACGFISVAAVFLAFGYIGKINKK